MNTLFGKRGTDFGVKSAERGLFQQYEIPFAARFTRLSSF
jgi:hypothetical protein